MSMVVDGLSWLLLIAGSGLVVTGGIGLVRMPDFFTRLHPSGVVDTMGASLVVAGLILQADLDLLLQADLPQVSAKLLLILVFLFFTSPTATHAVAHAALAGRLEPWTKSKRKDGA